ncbi:MAG: molybdate ABC transporter substrate-binding protein [Chloroflexi bacterium]|nr:molybdate ABC transporter substrate-binding protein [Chloroflexota bacterium]
MRHGRRIATLSAAALLLLAGCSGTATAPGNATAPGSATAPPIATSLTVDAAASLAGVLEAARSRYDATHPGTSLTIDTDSSAALATQIEQGAPVDVFLSADTTNPQALIDRGLASGALVPFAANLLTIIVPTADPAAIRTPADLARPGVKIIAAGPAVPITRYATRLVANLAALPGYPAGFAAAYAANVASREDNVAAVVAKVALGEGDAAIVYVTDAATSPGVIAVPVPAAANVPATYAGVVVRASRDLIGAQAFLAWFAGPDGQAILRSFGFLPPP